MKSIRLGLMVIALAGAMCVYGQNNDSLKKVIAKPLTEIQRDSLLTSIEEKVGLIATRIDDDAFWKNRVGKYKVYRTTNTYNSLKLNTATGRVTALQIGINNDKSRFEYPVCDAVNPDSNIIGRYELYPTGNIYNFILIDTIFGYAYQVQWSTEGDKCGRWAIW